MLKHFVNKLRSPVVALLCLSFGITFAISASFATSFWLVFQMNPIGVFLFCFAAQIVLFAIRNSIDIRRAKEADALIEAERLAALSKFTIKISCAYCKQENDVLVAINDVNRFKCEHCGHTSGIKAQFMSTQITTPLSVGSLNEPVNLEP